MAEKKKIKKVSNNKSRSSRSFWLRKWKEALILFVLAITLYGISVTFDYTLDDTIVIKENNYTKKGFEGIGELLTTESFQGYFGKQMDLLVGARYRPLSLVTFAVEQELFGMDPMYGHITNTLLYALTGLMLFRLLYLMIPSLKKGDWFLAFPFIASLLFIAHPVHSEAVANIKGRDEIMSFIFSIAALIYTLKYVKKGGILNLALVPVFFFLGLLSKENTITYLAVIPFTLYFFTKAKLKEYLPIMGLLLVSTVAYLTIRYNVIGYLLNVGKEITDLLNNPFYGMSLSEKYATISYTLLEYLRLLVFPHPLTHDYYPYHIPKMTWGDFGALAGLILNVGLGIYAVFGLFKKNIYSYCIWAYLAPLSVVCNIFFGVGTFMNERFIYMSSLGFIIALAYFLTRQFPQLLGGQKEKWNLIPGIILAVFILGFSVKTFTRVPVWKNKMSLNKAGVEVSKNSTRINCFVATAYFEEYQRVSDPAQKKELLEKADFHLERSLAIHPIYKNSLVMKAGVLAEQYKADKNLKKLLDGFLEVRKVRHIDYVDTYLDYLNSREDRVMLVDFYHRLSMSELAQKKKDYNSAVKYLNKGLEASPNDALLLKDLCIVYGFAGNAQRSAEYGEMALSVTPQDGELLYHLGVSYDHLGNKQKSEEYLSRARMLGVQKQ